jgi:hypothetical protein
MFFLSESGVSQRHRSSVFYRVQSNDYPAELVIIDRRAIADGYTRNDTIHCKESEPGSDAARYMIALEISLISFWQIPQRHASFAKTGNREQPG